MTPRRPPVVVLGVWRSGTTLLKETLNHHSELAIPGESYFLPALWERYKARQDTERLLVDVEYVLQVRQWGVSSADLRRRLPDGPAFHDVIRAIYESYAEHCGKRRFGDKTPFYMRHLELLEQAFSRPQYVHIVRDGRDAALSFAEMRARRRPTWIWPRDLGDFACRWRDEIEAARGLGVIVGSARYLELRYEDLIVQPEPKLREVCDFLGLRFEAGMLEYYGDIGPDFVPSPNHPRLMEPVSPSRRNWRDQMASSEVRRFEAIAGPLLSALGYERAYPRLSMKARVQRLVDRAVSRARIACGLPVPLLQRSPLWRWKQKRVLRRAGFEIHR